MLGVQAAAQPLLLGVAVTLARLVGVPEVQEEMAQGGLGLALLELAARVEGRAPALLLLRPLHRMMDYCMVPGSDEVQVTEQQLEAYALLKKQVSL